MRLAVENKELSRYIEILETRIKETIDDKDDCLFENWVNGD